MNDSFQDPTVDRDRPHPSTPPDDSKAFHRRRTWHRLWPQSIPGRLLMMFAVGLLIVQSLTGVLYWSDRQLNTTPARVKTVGNRIIAIADLMRSTPPEQQSILLDALNNPLLRVEVGSESPDYLFRQRGFRPFRQKRLDQLQAYLTDAVHDPIVIRVRPAHPPFRKNQDSPPGTIDGGSSRTTDVQPLLPSRHRVVVVIDQHPQWLVLTLPIGFGSRHHGPRFPVILLMLGVLIWVLFAWATRRITDPLLQFAAAADRLGLDVNAPPLPEQGSRELRQAAQAFNRMQGRLQRLIRDRTLMLAAISHDLGTILTRLRLRTEFMDDSSQRQKVQNDLSQMDIMLKSTLSFAKEDSTPDARTTFDLRSLVQSVCDDLVDSGYQITCDSGDRIPLQGQPTALRRAFTNLIQNAAIYGQMATVTVTSGQTSRLDASTVLVDGVEVAIADRGPGIAPEMREQVFKPFFRLERSRNRETGGTGLGLAVARTVIRRHGGEISLKNYPHPDETNQPDGGLLITVQLPKP